MKTRKRASAREIQGWGVRERAGQERARCVRTHPHTNTVASCMRARRHARTHQAHSHSRMHAHGTCHGPIERNKRLAEGFG